MCTGGVPFSLPVSAHIEVKRFTKLLNSNIKACALYVHSMCTGGVNFSLPISAHIEV